MPEDYLLTGPLEPTNEWYAIAKIAGIKMCQAYRKQYGFDAISAMPTNLYGPGDNFDLQSSHVLPALIRKFHEARETGATEVAIWGTGTPRREFLHVDDLADACVFLMKTYSDAAARQRRVGRGRLDRRTGAAGRRGHGVQRQPAVRCEQARRHAAQAARYVPAERGWMAAKDPPPGRRPQHGPVVSAEPDGLT